MSVAAFTGAALLVWTRHRAMLVAIAFVYAALLLAGGLLTARQLQPYQEQMLTFLRAMPFFLPLLLFVTPRSVFTIDIAARESRFPSHWFTLPVSTQQLVLPFMAGAVLLSAVLWVLAHVISDGRVLVSGPLHLPIEQLRRDFWFPFLLASLVAWTQALLWMSFKRRQARAWALLALVVWHATLLVLGASQRIHAPEMLAWSALQLLLSYPVAVWGVARARRGDPAPSESRARNRAMKQAREVRPFASASAAQSWFEWQAHRARNKSPFLIVVPLLAALGMLSQLKMSASNPTSNPVFEGLDALGRLAWILSFFAVIGGPYAASFQSKVEWTKDDAFAMPSFFAVLPLSTGDFAWAKIKLAAKGIASLCVLVALFTLALLPLFALQEWWTTLYATLRAQYSSIDPTLMVLAASLVVALFSIALAANSVWLALFGRRWMLVNIIVFAIALALTFGPRLMLRNPAVREALPAVLAVLAVVKLAVLAILIERVWHHRHYTARRIALVVGCWATAVAAVLALWLTIAPRTEAGTALSALIVLTPVLGVFAAPLALQFNRSR